MANIPDSPYEELPQVLREFAAGLRVELAENLVGAYLVGSLAVGDFDLDSDVDFLVVTRKELTDATARALQAMHVRIHGMGCYPAAHLEGSYFPQGMLNRAEAVGTEPLWYLDNGSTTLERSTHCNQWHTRWVLRERGVVLTGPDPREIVAPVAAPAMQREATAALRLTLDGFMAAISSPLSFWNSRFGQAFAVLNSCRVLYTQRTGVVQSKRAGATWAKQTLDRAWTGLIDQAWAEREGVRHCIKIRQRADARALQETLAFLQYLASEPDDNRNDCGFGVA